MNEQTGLSERNRFKGRIMRPERRARNLSTAKGNTLVSTELSYDKFNLWSTL